eukprot:5338961-Pleurochrysis_carterae.AAC.1
MAFHRSVCLRPSAHRPGRPACAGDGGEAGRRYFVRTSGTPHPGPGAQHGAPLFARVLNSRRR